MHEIRTMAAAVVIVAGGVALNTALSQQGVKRTEKGKPLLPRVT
jgi:hypothetical protein